MADDDFDEMDPAVADAVEKVLAKREAEAARKRERNKPPKDFADFVDRLADAVWDRGEQRAAEKRKASEDDDQEPGRAGAGDWRDSVRKFWTGDEAAG